MKLEILILLNDLFKAFFLSFISHFLILDCSSLNYISTYLQILNLE